MDNLSQQISLIISIAGILLIIAIGIIMLVVVYRKRQAEYIHQQIQLKAAFEKELLGAQIEMQEQTMRHIAQEIHDNVGQTLSLAKLNLARLNPETVTDKISNTKELVAKALADLRTLSKTLHKEAVLSIGLEAAIEMNVKLIDKNAGFTISFDVTGNPPSIDPQKELILFRTFQESLNNSIKHSGATHIQIQLNYTDNGLQLIIEDNGCGFDVEAVKKDSKRGLGLRNMQNRMALIGGTFQIKPSNPGIRIELTT